MEQVLTFDQLPKAVTMLTKEISDLKRLFIEKQEQTPTEKDELLTVQDTAKFLSLSVPTVYGLISKGELPVMKRSKRCYFSKIDLINYLKQGRKKSFAETANEADTYLKKKGGYNG
ncbi:MAG: helix-turn-helix domain-containing protein [Bacteroidales bacterium]|nr:helix-turn-helix domain-containing protein [Bacteroidales bacterium]